MKRMNRLIFPLFLLLALVLAACSGAEEATPAPTATPVVEDVMEEEVMEEEMMADIVDTAIADGRFSTLVAAVEAAGLVETLQGEGPFTVFAPTDDAFAALPEGTVESLLADPEGALTTILLYHVVAGDLKASGVVTLEKIATVANEPIDVSIVDGNVFLNEMVQVIITDIETANGTIHVIDGVLMPPSMAAEEAMDIVDTAVAAGSFNTLVAAVEAAGLVDALKGEGPLTVFAPTDEAFAALGEETIAALLADPETLSEILLYHVVDGAVFAADVVGLDAATTLQGEEVTITVDGEMVFVNEAQVVTTDIATSNGVIHVIDAVIMPPSMSAADEALADIVDTAIAAGSFNTLVTAVTEAGLVETLRGEGPFTVFAPTDEAFAALGEDAINELLADTEALTDVLLYHVVAGSVFAADVVALDNPAVPSVNGAPLLFSVTADGVAIADAVNNANIVITDIETSNGVIHVIDTVLLPPAGNIVETAIAAESFTTLVAAVEAAGLVETLSNSESSFTVFAPTDDAFAALVASGVDLDAVIADSELLTNILLYHVVDGLVPAAAVVQLESALTLLGENVTITVTDEGVFLNETTQVIVTDIVTSNGIIHVIDAVLLPAS